MGVSTGEGQLVLGVGEGQYQQTRKSNGFGPVSQAHLPQLPRVEGGTVSSLWPWDQAEITVQGCSTLVLRGPSTRPFLLPRHTPREGPDHLRSFPNLG